MPKKCSCNTFNSDDAVYCRNCGSKLASTDIKTDDGTTTGTTGGTTVTTSSSDTPDWVKVILTILVIGIAIAISCASIGIAAPVVAIGGWKCIQAIWED